MEKEVKIKQVVSYKGHSIKESGVIEISFKSDYSGLSESIQSLQLLNNDITIKCKMVNEKPCRLGVFRIKSINVSGDGESTIKFTSITDSVELENVNNIVTTEQFQIMLESMVEIEE